MCYVGWVITTRLRSASKLSTQLKIMVLSMLLGSRTFGRKSVGWCINVLVGQNKLRVHRVVLSARSPVFNILLRKHGHTGKSKLTFDADEVEFSVVELFLKYLYTGTLSITTSIIGRNVQSGDTERDLSTGRSCSGFQGHYHFLHRIILIVATKLYVVTNFLFSTTVLPRKYNALPVPFFKDILWFVSSVLFLVTLVS